MNGGHDYKTFNNILFDNIVFRTLLLEKFIIVII